MCRPPLPLALRATSLLLAALALGAAGPCGLEKAAELPLVGQAVPVVDVEIAGQPARLIVDTGAAVMALNQEAVARLGLRYDRDQRFEVRGIGGSRRSSMPAIVSGLKLGDVEVADQRAAELPRGAGGPALPGVDGVLSLRVLRQFDILLDMAQRRVTLCRGSPCDDSDVPLTGDVTEVDTGIDPHSLHLALPVQLDGAGYRAMLDTGSMGTIVVDRVAALSDWKLAGDHTLNMRGVGPDKAGAHRHLFAELTVGDDTADKPMLLVAEDPGMDFDIILGMDYLASRPIFLSFSTNRLYLQKPAGR